MNLLSDIRGDNVFIMMEMGNRLKERKITRKVQKLNLDKIENSGSYKFRETLIKPIVKDRKENEEAEEIW